MLATSLAAACATCKATAQSRPSQADAAAYPCAAQARLAVMPDQQGFSITAATPDKFPAPVVDRIPLGRHLQLDRALFARGAQTLKEATNAPRR